MAITNVSTNIDDDIKWKEQRFDWTTGDLDYRGVSLYPGASTSTGDLWWIWKYTWTANKVTRMEGWGWGNWDDRASYF